jgi:cytochrome c oxidase subunit II
VRRGVVLQVLFFGLVAAAITSAFALVPHWLPPAASEQAYRNYVVVWYVTIICVVIFAIVAAALAYSVLKFRRAPDDDGDGPPVHGHTGLEIAWTAIPFLLVTSMAILSAVVLARNDAVGANPLHVKVTAQQFAWSFKYPDQKNVTSNVLRVPEGRTVRLEFQALDVIHSFWVPEWSQKQDTVPGITTYLTVTPNKLGTFPIICTELCGLGHAVMRSTAIVLPPKAFDKWVTGLSKAASAGGAGAGKAVFEANGCGACHTLKAAGATGKIGPDLDTLVADAARAGKPLDVFVRESIVNPDAYIEKGFAKGLMPKTFATLPKAQLDALVQFLIQSAKGAK